MKTRPILPIRLLPVLLPLAAAVLAGTVPGPVPLSAADLTPEMIESIKAKMERLKEDLDGHVSERNKGAGDVFLSAASDPRKAVELYLKCQEEVNFKRKELSSSDFRQWKDQQGDRLGSPQFLESLQLQLRYLGISCRAAEVKNPEDTFSPLTSYVESLSRMEELPDQILTQSVADSVFSETYYLEDLLGSNDNWEPVPYNIEGIYERAIFPYLREEKPDELMTAWDKRIEQQTRIAAQLKELREANLRGMSRDQQFRARTGRNRRGDQGNVLGKYDEGDFRRETLPALHWAKMKDRYRYVDAVGGAQDMLAFVEKNLTQPNGQQWFDELEQLISERDGGGGSEDATAESGGTDGSFSN